MASDAYIGYAPSRIYGTPTTMLWVYRLGLEHAKQFLLTGRAIDAETAHRIGLVSHVVPPGELSALVEADARRFRHIPANQLVTPFRWTVARDQPADRLVRSLSGHI